MKTLFTYKLKIMQSVVAAIFKSISKFSASLPLVSLPDSSVKLLVSAFPLRHVDFEKTSFNAGLSFSILLFSLNAVLFIYLFLAFIIEFG